MHLEAHRRDLPDRGMPLAAVATVLDPRRDVPDRASPGRPDTTVVRAKAIIELGAINPDFETERAILLLALPGYPSATVEQISEVIELTTSELELVRGSKAPNMLFAWNANDYYYERLQLNPHNWPTE